MDSVGGNKKIGKITYKESAGTYPALDVKKVGDDCFLENENVIVYHMQNRTVTPRTAYKVPCEQVRTPFNPCI